ncbi:MAG: CPBP family glutamic-type intramembrane protease [Alphaproteobacteria bacterium]|nr:CPBP family glutamic-type intramembrane protease [Alphaproteobacteria bacterium]
MTAFLIAPRRMFLAFECAVLFVLMPMLVYRHPTRLDVHLGLLLVAVYAAVILNKTPGFSWREAWRGRRLTAREVKLIAARFIVSTFGIFLLTRLIEPRGVFSFPTQRPVFWLIVMILYPFLSALPQEMVFRCFFFRRYAALFPHKGAMLFASAFVFGFTHIVFHNPISPILSFICGFFLAASYLAHDSLKKAAIEHALYGDMVFTVGLGYYFLVGFH